MLPSYLFFFPIKRSMDNHVIDIGHVWSTDCDHTSTQRYWLDWVVSGLC